MREFVRARGLELSAAVGGATYAESFGARDFPMSFVIDPDGKVQAFFEGYDRRCLPAVEYELRRALKPLE